MSEQTSGGSGVGGGFEAVCYTDWDDNEVEELIPRTEYAHLFRPPEDSYLKRLFEHSFGNTDVLLHPRYGEITGISPSCVPPLLPIPGQDRVPSQSAHNVGNVGVFALLKRQQCGTPRATAALRRLTSGRQALYFDWNRVQVRSGMITSENTGLIRLMLAKKGISRAGVKLTTLKYCWSQTVTVSVPSFENSITMVLRGRYKWVPEEVDHPEVPAVEDSEADIALMLALMLKFQVGNPWVFKLDMTLNLNYVGQLLAMGIAVIDRESDRAYLVAELQEQDQENPLDRELPCRLVIDRWVNLPAKINPLKEIVVDVNGLSVVPELIATLARRLLDHIAPPDSNGSDSNGSP